MTEERSPGVVKQASRRWGIWLLIPLAVSCLVLCLFGREWRGSLRVERVIFEGSRFVPVQVILNLADIRRHTLMDSVDLYEVRQRVLSQPFIRSVRVNRLYPDAIRISVAERDPIALVNRGQLCYVDEEGMLLPNIQMASPVDVPIISGVDSLRQFQIGERAGVRDLIEAINLLRASQAVDTSLYRLISEVKMGGEEEIRLYCGDAALETIIGRGDIVKKLLILQSFWDQVMEQQNVDSLRQLDLRYANQVVLRWKSGANERRPI